MTTTYVSRDRHWRVRSIILSGRTLLRVEHDQVAGTPVPVVSTGRASTVRRAGGWFWAADVRSAAEVEKYVPLYELEEVTP